MCLTTRGEPSWNTQYVMYEGKPRKLSCVEWERLQTIPDNYTQVARELERYRMIGNAWTVNVVAHILRGINV